MRRSALVLRNSTPYRTDDLRRLVLACLRAMGASEARRVEFFPAKRSSSRGWGEYGDEARGEGYLVRVPVDRDDPNRSSYGYRTAAVLAHEVAHTLGLRHGEMSDELRYCRSSLSLPWAEGIVVRRKAEPAKPTLSDRVAEREETARKKVAEWTRRLALARTKVRLWKRKVAYYDRRRAVAASPAATALPSSSSSPSSLEGDSSRE